MAKKKKKVKKPVVSRRNMEESEEAEKSQAKACFICNGTGSICDRCGEAQNACGCGAEADDAGEFSDCKDCNGTGRATTDVQAPATVDKRTTDRRKIRKRSV